MRGARTSRVEINYGPKGSGKSWDAKRRVEKSPRRIAIWDPKFEWVGEKDSPRVGSTTVNNLREFADATIENGGRIDRVLVFNLGPELFDNWAKWVQDEGDQLVVIDEAPLVLNRDRMNPVRLALATTTRHSRIDLLLCAQRPARLAPDVRSQADEVRAWRMIERLDLKALEGSYGSQFADRVKLLRGHDFTTWRPGR
tara:strand:- start:69 stop:662 length:594 start_codon:yes stop_codon:yes gene_type:complete